MHQCVSIVIPRHSAGPNPEELDDELLEFDEQSTYAALDIIESVPITEVYGRVMGMVRAAAMNEPADVEGFAAEMSGAIKAMYIAERHRKNIAWLK